MPAGVGVDQVADLVLRRANCRCPSCNRGLVKALLALLLPVLPATMVLDRLAEPPPPRPMPAPLGAVLFAMVDAVTLEHAPDADTAAGGSRNRCR